MAWFTELAGKAENLLTNLDQQTGAVLRNHKTVNFKESDLQESPLLNPVIDQSKHRKSRIAKRNTNLDAKANCNLNLLNKKSSPLRQNFQSNKKNTVVRDKSPTNRSFSPRRQSLHCAIDYGPKCFMREVKRDNKVDQVPYVEGRRHSLPSDLELLANGDVAYKMQNLEVENAMLRNELNVMNKEVIDLLHRLRRAENDLSDTHIKLEETSKLKEKHNEEKQSLSSEIELLKKKFNDVTFVELPKLKEKNELLVAEIDLVKNKKREQEDKINLLTDDVNKAKAANVKLENDLRHAQTVINDLQHELERSRSECERLEKDWETYKLRVKSMLHSKDEQIKSLQNGMCLNENTKQLTEQIEFLKVERESLTEAITRVRSECEDMKQCMDQLKYRHENAERVVVALRDALRDERGARNKAEVQCLAIGKELKSLQMESGETIANLRNALRDKESELNHFQEASSVRINDTSALNVADYDVSREADAEKIEYLTQMLVQKQTKIDSLLAEGSMLKIQLDKIESKYKREVAALHTNGSHSIVNLDEDHKPKSRPKFSPVSPVSMLSMRLGVLFRRNPIFRVFIIIYMIFLHVWVLTVLFASTPEVYRKPTT